MLQLEELQSAQYITINGEDLAIINADIWKRLLEQLQIPPQQPFEISPLMAQRKVTGYVVDHISNLMHGGKPMLIVRRQTFYWRIPIVLSMPPRGDLGEVGTIDVHARTGELAINQPIIEEMIDRAEHLATSSSPSPAT